jgi:C4-dicarboxylate-specific signal transduction histidine kinase
MGGTLAARNHPAGGAELALTLPRATDAGTTAGAT